MHASTCIDSLPVLYLEDAMAVSLCKLLARYGLSLQVISDGDAIPGSYWGDNEAGIVGTVVFARSDTPLHSILHEACHIICMDEHRRTRLHRDAGSNDIEEAAVCYLQIVLAEDLNGVGSERMMQDMDAWGYSFRLGSTRRWFYEDASDARGWLSREGLLSGLGKPSYRCRGAANIPQ